MQFIACPRYEDLLQDLGGTVKGILRGRGLPAGSREIVDVDFSHNIGDTLTGRKYYLEREYMRFFSARSVRKIKKGLDQKLESGLGYRVLPGGAWRAQEEATVSEREEGRGLLLFVWECFINILWWTVVPTVTLLLVTGPFALWRQSKADADRDQKSLGQWPTPTEFRPRGIDPRQGVRIEGTSLNGGELRRRRI